MAFVQTGSVRLEYFEQGYGPQTVVFIHGFEASARIWQMVQAALPSDRFTTYAINNRGAGRSDTPPDGADYGIPVFAADAYDAASALGLTRFTLVGHSLGGGTVANFALDHPEMVEGLVLLDPVDPDGPPMPSDIERILDARIAERKSRLPYGEGGDRVRDDHPHAVLLRLLNADMNAAPEQRLRGSLRSLFDRDLGQRVGQLAMPVLLVAGDADAVIPLSAMLATWAKYPAGTGLHVWHGVGHSPNLECPVELAALLARFINQTVATLPEGANPAFPSATV